MMMYKTATLKAWTMNNLSADMDANVDGIIGMAGSNKLIVLRSMSYVAGSTNLATRETNSAKKSIGSDC